MSGTAAAAATPAAETVDELDAFASVFSTLSDLKEGEAVPANLTAPPPEKTAEETAAEAAAAKTAEEAAAAEAAAAAAAKKAEEEGLPDPADPDGKIAADEAARAAAAAGEKDKTATPPPAPDDDRLTKALDKLAERLAPKEPVRKEEPVQTPALTQEEAVAVANYLKEFPEIAAAEQAIRRYEIKQAAQYIFAQVEEALKGVIAPLGQLSTSSHKSALLTAIPDYNDVRDPVIKWVGVQPGYLQAAFNQVVTEGSVEEIKDLVDRWRKETGTAAPAAQPATSGQKDSELPTAAKQAALRLAPVGTKRSTVVHAPSNQDFDGAFDTFAKET